MQLSLDMAPRARRSDPQTSHAAAARAASFASTHAGRIHVALTQGPATAHELSERTGLSVVQIDRRVSQMCEEGFIRVVTEDGKPVAEGGKPVTRGGFRVLEAVK
jgi:predicted transcriptional regulator